MQSLRAPQLLLALGAAMVVSGCGSGNDLYPLKVGNEWQYTVLNGFSERVQSVKVARRVPVAGSQGFELQGPMGPSRLVWKGNTLYATMLPNARLLKAMPLLIANDPKGHAMWHGVLMNVDKAQPADADLKQQPETIELGTKKYDTIKATLTLQSGDKNIEVESWYAKGIGPIRQEQRVGGKLLVKVELLGGP